MPKNLRDNEEKTGKCRHYAYCPLQKTQSCSNGSCAVGDLRAESYFLSGKYGSEVQQKTMKTLNIVNLTEQLFQQM